MSVVMEELLRRVEAARGPDRILDASIARDVAGLCLHGNWHSEGPDGDRGRVCDGCGADSWGNLGKMGQRLNGPLPVYTTSIDAALSLVEQMLPGSEYDISTIYSQAYVRLPLNGGDANPCEEATRKDGNVPLAILAALLKALTK